MPPVNGKSHDKPDEQDFHRAECPKQDFGGYEGGSPYEDGDKCGQMACGGTVMIHDNAPFALHQVLIRIFSDTVWV